MQRDMLATLPAEVADDIEQKEELAVDADLGKKFQLIEVAIVQREKMYHHRVAWRDHHGIDPPTLAGEFLRMGKAHRRSGRESRRLPRSAQLSG